jgi:hypothetical protein
MRTPRSLATVNWYTMPEDRKPPLVMHRPMVDKTCDCRECPGHAPKVCGAAFRSDSPRKHRCTTCQTVAVQRQQKRATKKYNESAKRKKAI